MFIDGGIVIVTALSQLICNSSEEYLVKVLQTRDATDELIKRSIQ